VRERYGWATLVEPEENLGFGPGVNLGAEGASGDWIAAANADIELAPGALARLVAAGAGDPDAGIVAPQLVLTDGSPQHSAHAFPSPSLAAVLALGLPALSSRLAERLCVDGAWDPGRERYVDWAHGALLLIRRDAFEAVGGFDPAQWMYAEDIDIAWRLSRRGLRVRYVPAARVGHAVSAATAKAFGDAGRQQRHIAASYAWMLRRRGPVATRTTALANVAGAAVRWALFAALAPLDARWRTRREQQARYIRRHRLGLRPKAKILRAA
jgi:N-acetylglucosaminyl-diphospho-decaprenol L-rhamnosyltransferase